MIKHIYDETVSYISKIAPEKADIVGMYHNGLQFLTIMV